MAQHNNQPASEWTSYGVANSRTPVPHGWPAELLQATPRCACARLRFLPAPLKRASLHAKS